MVSRGNVGVARDAIGEAGMVKHHRGPIGCVMAVGTLPGVMVRGSLLGVAGDAIGKASVVKYH